MNVSETEVWAGSPSQILNAKPFFWCGLFFWLVIPLAFMFWKWLEVRNIRYEVSSERIRSRQGVFSKKVDYVELYRVKDFRIEQPFIYRLFSVANLILDTSDRSHPLMILRAVPNAEWLKDQIRANVERLRVQKHVRELDV